MAPVEIGVLVVGYVEQGRIATRCRRAADEHDRGLRLHAGRSRVVQRPPDYFRLVLNAREVPCDSLLAAAIVPVACRAARLRREYLVGCGRACASLLGSDLQRLAGVLAQIDPG